MTMSQTITLYVDGACKGNPGPGGWGAFVITETEEHKLCGGERDTTNNRMELSAAIEGIAFCPTDAKLIMWTDSNYVKRGITEWIEGWKKKNWKDVKNPDLWKKLDQTCKGREIEWNWIKGHAGHPGNEMADQLANLGTERILKGEETPLKTSNPISNLFETETKKKVEKDWLLDDPFGFDLMADDENEADVDESAKAQQINSPIENTLSENALSENTMTETKPAVNASVESDSIENRSTENKVLENSQIETQISEVATLTKTSDESNISVTLSPTSSTFTIPANLHPQIVITPATVELFGPRQFILDTETTGFYYQDTDRIIEVGALEMINRKLTGSSIHIYINPKKPVGDSENVHGISDDFLKDKPKYEEIAQVLFDYLKGSEIIAHNASFDMNFLDMEFARCGLATLSSVCEVTDTLAMAKRKHPGQKNNLDALVRRYEVPQRDRTFHGALLDAEILSDVYLAMTGGQVSFDMTAISEHTDYAQGNTTRQKIEIDAPVILPSNDELEAHENWIKQYQEKHGEACIFAK